MSSALLLLSCAGQTPARKSSTVAGPSARVISVPSIVPTEPDASPASKESNGSRRAKHGGVLADAETPVGRVIIETSVEQDGTVRIYATDAAGNAIPPADVSGSVTCERGPVRTTLPVTAKSRVSTVESRCSELGPPETIVAYHLSVRGLPVSGRLHVSPTGTAGVKHDVP